VVQGELQVRDMMAGLQPSMDRVLHAARHWANFIGPGVQNLAQTKTLCRVATAPVGPV